MKLKGDMEEDAFRLVESEKSNSKMMRTMQAAERAAQNTALFGKTDLCILPG